MKKKSIAKLLLATVTSAVSGAVIGLLMAPDKGSSTRKKLIKRGDEYLKELKNEMEEVRQSLNEKAEATKDDIGNLSKEARRKGDDIVKQAKKLTSYEEWTKDELYERAKKLGIESYSTLNKTELIKALRDH